MQQPVIVLKNKQRQFQSLEAQFRCNSLLQQAWDTWLGHLSPRDQVHVILPQGSVFSLNAQTGLCSILTDLKTKTYRKGSLVRKQYQAIIRSKDGLWELNNLYNSQSLFLKKQSLVHSWWPKVSGLLQSLTIHQATATCCQQDAQALWACPKPQPFGSLQAVLSSSTAPFYSGPESPSGLSHCCVGSSSQLWCSGLGSQAGVETPHSSGEPLQLGYLS